MKPYPAVMREKRRYCAFEILSEAKFRKQSVAQALRGAVVKNVGEAGAAAAGFMLIEFDEASQKGILRCTNKELERIRSSIAMITDIENHRAFIKITDVTGTIKKSKEVV